MEQWKEATGLLPIVGYFDAPAGAEESVMAPGEIKSRDTDLDVAFWNIEWFNKNVDAKVRTVARFIADMNLDVWALEETSPKATERLVRLLEEAYGLDFDFDSSEPNAANAKQSTTVMWNRNTVNGKKLEWPAELDEVIRLSSNGDLSPLERLEAEEAVHGRIFDRYPGLFHLESVRNPRFQFNLVPLHLKAMAEGSLRRRLASRVLVAIIRVMIERHAADPDWVLGGDLNAEMDSDDFRALDQAGFFAAHADDAESGAISYLKGPKSLIDHVYLSKNLTSQLGEGQVRENFVIVKADAEIPNYIKSVSDHRPVMIRLAIEPGAEEGAMPSVQKWPGLVQRVMAGLRTQE